jgi:cytochrome P450
MPASFLAQRVVSAAEDAERRQRFPRGATLTFEDFEAAGRGHVLDAVREAEPVTWVPVLGMWLVAGHAAAREALSPRTPLTTEAEPNLVRASLGLMMLTTDGDEHARLRAPFERPFRMREVAAAFGPAIGEEVDALLAPVIPTGECEIGAAFAAPYAVRMAGRMLGLSLGDTARIDGFYAAFAGAMVYDGDPEPQRRADGAREALNAILHRELERCRAAPDGSLTAAIGGDPDGALTDEEIVAQMRVVMFGAIETIQAAIMNTLLLLLRDGAALDLVRADPTALAGAIEESLRVIPPVAFIERWTRTATTIGGIAIPAAEFVGVSALAANRDPAAFADPLRYDPRRANARHALSFSFGIHHCIGAHLARIEILGALRAILDRAPGLRLVSCEEPAGFAFRRPDTLHLAWDVDARGS